MVAAGCSQRAQWRAVPSPAPRQQAVANATLSVPAVAPDATAVAHMRSLYFPVPGVDSTRLDDSFEAPRDGGRRHNAIDIMAPRGTPVLSVEDGRILRLATNANGGITLYATNADEQFVYYYAHLDRYHPGIYTGRPLMRGDTIAYVGTTGNAPKNTPHLHFQVMRMPADRKYWNGEPINPYPLLKAAPSPTGR
jgi:murein DD-endopeptidase MepM/ murein hydrolase activator NlpD